MFEIDWWRSLRCMYALRFSLVREDDGQFSAPFGITLTTFTGDRDAGASETDEFGLCAGHEGDTRALKWREDVIRHRVTSGMW